MITRAGAGQSGKSTILKQMKLIHAGGYSWDERTWFKSIVYTNTLQSMRSILEAMTTLGLSVDDETVDIHARIISAQPVQILFHNMPTDVSTAIAALWKDSGIRECFHRSSEYQLDDSAG